MAKLTMNSGWEKTLRARVRPGMEDLGKEMLAEWLPTIPVKTGEMKAKAYVDTDSEGEITIGSQTHNGHAYWEEMGTSKRHPHHTLLPVVTKDRGRRDV